MIIGVVSDTHGRLHREIPRVLAGVERILHAGDIGDPHILGPLQSIAPVLAVLGNVDEGALEGHFPRERVEKLDGVKILVVHQLGSPGRAHKAVGTLIERERPGVVVFGHTHRPFCQRLDGILYLNPGGAGPRRFGLPRSVALLDTAGGVPTARVIALDPTPAKEALRA